jgi:hypothetical protein
MHKLNPKVLLLHRSSAVTYASQASIFKKMAERTISTGVAQWDPVVDLSLFRFPDGSFRCAGVKKGTTNRCGYHLEGDQAKDINQMVYNISRLAPQKSVPSLESLATSCLCHHHILQTEVKVTAWTEIVLRHPLAAVRASDTSSFSNMVRDPPTGFNLPLTYELDASTETSGQITRPRYSGARQSSTEQIESLLVGMKQLQVTTTYLETRLEEAMTDTFLWKQPEPRTRRIGCLSSLFSRYRTKGR